MEDNPKTLSERKRNRMDGYDYSLCGAYFVTICLKNRECFLWKTVGADIIRPNNAYELSEYGRIVEEEIKRIINEAINYSKEIKTDIFSLGNLVYKKDHKLWKSIKDNWDNELNNLEIEVTVNLDLKTKGSIDNIIEVR